MILGDLQMFATGSTTTAKRMNRMAMKCNERGTFWCIFVIMLTYADNCFNYLQILLRSVTSIRCIMAWDVCRCLCCWHHVASPARKQGHHATAWLPLRSSSGVLSNLIHVRHPDPSHEGLIVLPRATSAFDAWLLTCHMTQSRSSINFSFLQTSAFLMVS